jgi:hypothetical protein
MDRKLYMVSILVEGQSFESILVEGQRGCLKWIGSFIWSVL